MRWVWLVAGVLLMVAELSTATLVLLPLALGAFAAAAAAFFGGGVIVQLVAAAVVAVVSFVGLRPIARRVEEVRNADTFGARRLVNAKAVLLTPGDSPGGAWVKVDGETWRAEVTTARPLEAGEVVRVVDVQGTHVLVVPFEAPLPPQSGKSNERNEER